LTGIHDSMQLAPILPLCS